MMARVRGPIRSSIRPGSMSSESWSTSTIRGVAAASRTAPTVAAAVCETVITSSPRPIPRARAMTIRAGPRSDGDGVAGADIRGKFPLECLSSGPNQVARPIPAAQAASTSPRILLVAAQVVENRNHARCGQYLSQCWRKTPRSWPAPPPGRSAASSRWRCGRPSSRRNNRRCRSPCGSDGKGTFSTSNEASSRSNSTSSWSE